MDRGKEGKKRKTKLIFDVNFIFIKQNHILLAWDSQFSNDTFNQFFLCWKGFMDNR